MNKKKLQFKTVQELQEHIKNNGYTNILLFCNDYLKSTLDGDKIANRLVNKYVDNNINYNKDTLYFDMYSNYILLPKMLKEYYKSNIFNVIAINKALILEHGRNYSDGFSGIRIKKMSYTNDYIIEVVDGERGQLFCKTYKRFPELNQLIYDSIFYNVLCNDDTKEYKPSLIDLF